MPGLECYHRPEISEGSSAEVDIIYKIDGTLNFVEIKWLMPPIRMNSLEGIEILNDKFNNTVFKEESEVLAPKSGKPFHEKVDLWMDLEAGDSFSSQVGREKSDREESEFKEEWKEMDMQKMVISNLVSSYIEKNWRPIHNRL